MLQLNLGQALMDTKHRFISTISTQIYSVFELRATERFNLTFSIESILVFQEDARDQHLQLG